jgi:hypothetical protein
VLRLIVEEGCQKPWKQLVVKGMKEKTLWIADSRLVTDELKTKEW